MPAHRALLGAALVAVASPSCRTATQIVVYVDSDLDPNQEISAFGVHVGHLAGETPEPVKLDRERFELGDYALPASFGVAPIDGDPSRRVEVGIDALLDEGDPLFTTRARTSFIEYERPRLDMYLARRCMVESSVCDENGMTCGRFGCTDVDVVLTGDERPPEDVGWTREWTVTLGVRGPTAEGDLYATLDGGDVFVAGNFGESIVAGLGNRTGVVVNPGAGAGFAAKFLPDGQLQWRVALIPDADAGQNVRVTGIASHNGHVYVVGTFTGRLHAPYVIERNPEDTTEVTLESEGPSSGFLLVFDHTSFILNHTQFGGPQAWVEVNDVAAKDGQIAVTGVFQSVATFFGDEVETTSETLFASVSTDESWENGATCPLVGYVGDGIALGLDGTAKVIAVPLGRVGEAPFLLDVEGAAGEVVCTASGPTIGDGLVEDAPMRVAAGGHDASTETTAMAGTLVLPSSELCAQDGLAHGAVVSSRGWTRALCSTARDVLKDVTVDLMGTSYVVGIAEADLSIDGVPAVPAGGFAAAFDYEGRLLWTIPADRLAMTEPVAIAYEQIDGAIVVAGVHPSDGGVDDYVVQRILPP